MTYVVPLESAHGPRVLERRPQPEVLYRIWSNEHGMWWAPDERGFTMVLERSGRYSLAAAERIIRQTLHGGLIVREGMSVPTEHLVPVPPEGYGS